MPPRPHYWHDLPGPIWFCAAAIYARQVARARDGDVFVELGAWKGRSTVYMAVEIANSGKAIKFSTVDHWRGSLEPAHEGDEDLRAGRLYATFLANVTPVLEYVAPICGETAEVAKQFEDDSVDFVYVDAGHRYCDVQADLAAWWPKLRIGGTMAGDDWCDEDDDHGVRRAVTEFFGDRDVEIVVEPGSPNPEWLQWLVERTS